MVGASRSQIHLFPSRPNTRGFACNRGVFAGYELFLWEDTSRFRDLATRASWALRKDHGVIESFFLPFWFKGFEIRTGKGKDSKSTDGSDCNLVRQEVEWFGLRCPAFYSTKKQTNKDSTSWQLYRSSYEFAICDSPAITWVRSARTRPFTL